MVGMTLGEIEKEVILATMAKYNNQTIAAKVLGICHKTLYNKLKSYGVLVKNSTFEPSEEAKKKYHASQNPDGTWTYWMT